MNTKQLFRLACSGNIKALEEYWNRQGDLNITYEKFGKKHSLIMGAFRNQQYDTVIWLKNHGCQLTDKEQDEINIIIRRLFDILFSIKHYLECMEPILVTFMES